LKSGSPPSTRPDPDPASGTGDALVEFEVLAEAAYADALGDALVQAGALAVSVEDAQADSDCEQALYGEPDSAGTTRWNMNRMKVLIGPDQEPGDILALAAAAAGIEHPVVQATRKLTDRDWVVLSQSQFAPVQVGHLWVVPSWVEPPEPDALVLRLDPGMAFGTGTHPTTRLCLLWLQDQPLAGRSVLDYGCGSGILAIAAARLGAAVVRGVDIDPLACRAARENSSRNGVHAVYTLPDSSEPPAAEARFDVIVANILANPLAVLAPALLARLSDSGRIALSGILEQQAAAVIDAYREADPRLQIGVWRDDGDWVCLAGQRTES
jgi:ribosomal protein L11 methyltransferase